MTVLESPWTIAPIVDSRTDSAHPTNGADHSLVSVAVAEALKAIRRSLSTADCEGLPEGVKHAIFATGRELAESIGLRSYSGMAAFGEDGALTLVADLYAANRRLEIECRLVAEQNAFQVSRVSAAGVSSTGWLHKIYDHDALADWLLTGQDASR